MKKQVQTNNLAGFVGAIGFLVTTTAEAAHWSSGDVFSNLDLTALITGLLILPALVAAVSFLIVSAGRKVFREWHVRKGWAQRLVDVYGRRSRRVLHSMEDEIVYDVGNRFALTIAILTVIVSILLSYNVLLR